MFRGISMEGGCYPSLGAEEMAVELSKVMYSHGGKILIRAQVEKICVVEGKVSGVMVRPSNYHDSSSNGNSIIKADSDDVPAQFIKCNRVVSSAGYSNTFNKLISAEVTSQLNIPRQLSVPQSAGFVMANIGNAYY